MDTTGGTSYTSGFCEKCGKQMCYVGDIPTGGFSVGNEPYCTCGSVICKECGKRYYPKCKECNQ